MNNDLIISITSIIALFLSSISIILTVLFKYREDRIPKRIEPTVNVYTESLTELKQRFKTRSIRVFDISHTISSKGAKYYIGVFNDEEFKMRDVEIKINDDHSICVGVISPLKGILIPICDISNDSLNIDIKYLTEYFESIYYSVNMNSDLLYRVDKISINNRKFRQINKNLNTSISWHEYCSKLKNK